MENSAEIAAISKALVVAQLKMGTAKKDSNNPFFKSKYADLNAIREACIPALNEVGISVLQPTVQKDGKNFVQTILLHESGEYISGLTEIVYNKPNDAQAQGSGITYARRYGLQSMCNVGAEDDDGNKASQPVQNGNGHVIAPTAATTKSNAKVLPTLEIGSQQYMAAAKWMNDGGSIDAIEKKYVITPEIREKLLNPVS